MYLKGLLRADKSHYFNPLLKRLQIYTAFEDQFIKIAFCTQKLF